MLQLHGRAYHRIMDPFRGQYNERAPAVNKARMCIYDAVTLRQAEAIAGIDMDSALSLSPHLSAHTIRGSPHTNLLFSR